MYTPKPTRPAPVMYPLRMSHFSTLAISTGASPICFLRRLPNASESSPRTRRVSHPWVRDDSHSTSSPVAFLAMIVRSRFGSRLRTFSGIFSARVLDCQPFFSWDNLVTRYCCGSMRAARPIRLRASESRLPKLVLSWYCHR